jgi:hypothetical protein
MEVGRRKKEEAVIAMVSAIKNVLTVLAVAIQQLYLTVFWAGCKKTGTYLFYLKPVRCSVWA